MNLALEQRHDVDAYRTSIEVSLAQIFPLCTRT